MVFVQLTKEEAKRELKSLAMKYLMGYGKLSLFHLKQQKRTEKNRKAN